MPESASDGGCHGPADGDGPADGEGAAGEGDPVAETLAPADGDAGRAVGVCAGAIVGTGVTEGPGPAQAASSDVVASSATTTRDTWVTAGRGRPSPRSRAPRP